MTGTQSNDALDALFSEKAPADSRRAKQLDRRQKITEAVMAEGSVRIEDITERFDISLMTAHRDIDELVARGLLRKYRGLVSAAPTSLIEASDVYRAARQQSEKRALAELAMEFIDSGQALLMDDSTTVLQMAPLLGEKTPLTVITNSLTLMNAVNEIRDLELIGLGGRFHNWCNAFIGPVTRHEISRFMADTYLLSTSAIMRGQLFHQSPEMVETKRAMFEAAQRRILMADHVKFEQRALYHLANISEFDVVIVDDQVDAQSLAMLNEADVELHIARTH
ncbi:DeoR family transcriptional regulator [Spiribacter roseus]|nr:DeoR family transcriptional regulator [Spiribacter roseus]